MPHPRKQKSHSSRSLLGPIHFSGVRGHPHLHLMHDCLPFGLWLSHFPQNITSYINYPFYGFDCFKQLTLSFFKREPTFVFICCCRLSFPVLALTNIINSFYPASWSKLLKSNKAVVPKRGIPSCTHVQPRVYYLSRRAEPAPLRRKL